MVCGILTDQPTKKSYHMFIPDPNNSGEHHSSMTVLQRIIICHSADVLLHAKLHLIEMLILYGLSNNKVLPTKLSVDVKHSTVLMA
jgi:hypothetical protein